MRVNLPIHSMLLMSIQDVQITPHDGFILIEAESKKIGDDHAFVNFKKSERAEEQQSSRI